ncbi:MAG: tetratricopeptide repeat protein [Nitrospirae bacterium]|nr:tetratricopeptide repeat protein [Nitrospirota bacterium]
MAKTIIEFHKTFFTLQENPAVPAPHVEILVAVDPSGNAVHPQAPAPHVETLVEIESSGHTAHPGTFPTWIRIVLDDLPEVEHPYSEIEGRALADGGLQPLLTAPFTAGRHTLAVMFKGVSQSGKSYLKAKGFTFETARPVAHVVLRFLSFLNDEPELTLTVIEQSWLESPPSGSATEDPVYRLGVFANGVGEYGKAASFFLASLERHNPVRSDDHRLRLAEAYAGAGLPEEAEALLKAVIAQSPDEVSRARAWLLIERFAFRDGLYARAIEAYERADVARLGSSLPSPLLDDAHLFAGTSGLVLHQYQLAAAAFRRVTRSGPDAPFALYGHAQAVAGLGDAHTASGVFKTLAESRSPSDPVQARVADFARTALGFQRIEQGRHEEALSELGQVRPAHPAYEAALFGVGWALQKMGEHVKAIAIFQDLITRFPHGEHVHEARLAMASSYADLRAYTRAVTAYRAALEAGMASLRDVDRLRGALDNPNWDPVAERLTDDDSVQAEPAASRSMERYRWLLRSEQELRRTLDRVPESPSFAPSGCSDAQKPCSNARGNTPRAVDTAQLVAEGRTLLVDLDALKGAFRGVLRGQAHDALDREQQRLEDWAVQASVGIAKNLIADRDELGSEALTVD